MQTYIFITTRAKCFNAGPVKNVLHVVETGGVIGEGWTGRSSLLLPWLRQNGHRRHLLQTPGRDGWSIQETAFFLDLERRRSDRKLE